MSISTNPTQISPIERLLCPHCVYIIERPTQTFSPDSTTIDQTAQIIERNHDMGLELLEHLREVHDLGKAQRLQAELDRIRLPLLNLFGFSDIDRYSTEDLVIRLASEYHEVKAARDATYERMGNLEERIALLERANQGLQERVKLESDHSVAVWSDAEEWS